MKTLSTEIKSSNFWEKLANLISTGTNFNMLSNQPLKMFYFVCSVLKILEMI